jgi:hypothetical protein
MQIYRSAGATTTVITFSQQVHLTLDVGVDQIYNDCESHKL